MKEVEAEFSVIGALLIDNDSIDRIGDLEDEHFYNYENKMIFSEIKKQIIKGSRVDVLTVYDAIGSKIDDSLILLNKIANSVGSAANISRYASIIVDNAIKRGLVAISNEIHEIVAANKESSVCVDLVASKVDLLAQRKTQQHPRRMSEYFERHVKVLEDRLSGAIKLLKTGFQDLDNKLGGGLEAGTLIVVAGRPGMGKTAFGLNLARNAAERESALFLSMEMDESQVSDRNLSALGKIPINWLRDPQDKSSADKLNWQKMTAAFASGDNFNLFIDDKTGLNLLEIRNKVRYIKRKFGLELLVVDQLSFIKGAKAEKSWDAIGEYTRGLIQIAKENKIAVVLLAQLNRDCEKRQNRRPQLSDLAASGSIEQDASTIIFLYRDEVYNPDSPDKGICEVAIAKQRQGSTGVTGLAYIGEQTRFESLAREWKQEESNEKKEGKGRSYSAGFD